MRTTTIKRQKDDARYVTKAESIGLIEDIIGWHLNELDDATDIEKIAQCNSDLFCIMVCEHPGVLGYLKQKSMLPEEYQYYQKRHKKLLKMYNIKSFTPLPR